MVGERCLSDTGAWGYRSYREYLQLRFPQQVIRKLCLNAGFSCPNLDGRVSYGGCTYCNNQGFVPKNTGKNHLMEQWDAGRIALRRRYGSIDGFIAYFQAFSNTYGPLEQLQTLYSGIHLKYPECVGLSISTRPDCIFPETVQLLEHLGDQTFTTLELGLQSDRDELLKLTNRGHNVKAFMDAIELVAHKNFDICVHFILGLPGEDHDAPERMGKLAAQLPIKSVKIHNLHIMRGTEMATQFQKGQLQAIGKTEYLEALARFVHQLRPDQYCQRVLADAPNHVLLSGAWCQKKQAFLPELQSALASNFDTSSPLGFLAKA
jgi:uncharacterized protein